MIDLNQVSKSYGSVVALHPTTLTLEANQTTALIGPSGCGKSTLLRLIVGLLTPDSGTILIDGRLLARESLREIRQQMGYVIQDGGLFPHLTARQNVFLLAHELKREPDWMETRLGALCDLTRFPKEGLGRYPAELSGGQRQRVGLMRALMLEPRVLLLDEPMGALDPMVRAALQTDLKSIFKSIDVTTLLVTHDMAEAGFLADRIVLLSEGRIVQDGTLADLRERPTAPFVTEFLHAQRSLVQL